MGSLVQEVRQQWSSWAYQTVKLYSNLPIAIFEYTIGPIPYEDKVGKEVVSRFTTDLKSNATWYTDSNGREMQKRM
ncbi:Alpha-mannosidase [Geodia barretti]|uniref:Alpha-mannosidase n=1 Tax=Geodia barretti TaxID=519541 RepID=A0AA35T4S2_GEOBA|nr:Alpha-mannosidase [Geodia barretti]